VSPLMILASPRIRFEFFTDLSRLSRRLFLEETLGTPDTPRALLPRSPAREIFSPGGGRIGGGGRFERERNLTRDNGDNRDRPAVSASLANRRLTGVSSATKSIRGGDKGNITDKCRKECEGR